MIISKTPFRVSFFGGGTDYPEWFRHRGGAVLSATIDKYCYITARRFPPFFQSRHRIVWSHIELVNSIAEILHPAVREGLRHAGFRDDEGIEIHHQGDPPARAGMGSSSCFAVGLVQVLAGLRGERFDPRVLASRAIELERDLLKEHVGWQDQIAAAFGGLNRIDFALDGSFEVHPVSASFERIKALEQRLMLIFTGTTRLSTVIAKSLVENLGQREATLLRMTELVSEGEAILEGQGDLDDFGFLLHEAWIRKRELSSQISNPTIDRVYDAARRRGALGGKLLGAGGSGFILLYAPMEMQAAIREELAHLVHVPFTFSKNGCQIIHHEP